jgi:hypothetical protein
MITYTIDGQSFSHPKLLQYAQIILTYWDKGLITNWEFKTQMEKIFAQFECPKEGMRDPNTGMMYKLTAQYENKE